MPIITSGAALHQLVGNQLGQVVYLLPPLCLNDGQLEQCYLALEAALDAL